MRRGPIVAALTIVGALSTATSAAAVPVLYDAHPDPEGHGGLAVAVAPDGRIWATDPAHDDLHRLDPDTGTVERFPVGTVEAAPDTVTVGADGDVWFAGTDEGVGRLDPDTGAVTPIIGAATDHTDAYALATGVDGRIWFTRNSPAALVEIEPSTNTITVHDDPTMSLNLGYGLEVGEDGTVWEVLLGALTEPRTDGSHGYLGLRAFDPDTGTATDHELPEGNGGGLGLTLDEDDHPWLTQSNDGALLELDPATGTFTPHALVGVTEPLTIASAGGFLWLTGANSSLLARYDPATETTDTAPVLGGTGVGGGGMDVDADGTVWATVNGVVLEVTEDETGPTVAITAPVDGTTFASGTAAVAGFQCVDDVEVASCEGSVTDGSSIDTADAGEHELVVVATDTSGNEASATSHYTVAEPGAFVLHPTPPSSAPRSRSTPHTIADAPDGSIWYSNAGSPWEGRMGHYDPSTGAYREYDVDPIVSDGSISAITVGDDGRVWFVGDGLQWLDPETGSTGSIPEAAPDHQVIKALTTGPDGRVWFTRRDDAGVGWVDPETEDVTFWPDPDLVTNHANDLEVDAHGIVWQPYSSPDGAEGIQAWDPETGASVAHPYARNNEEVGLLSLAVAPDGIWAGGFWQGVLIHLRHDGEISTVALPRGVDHIGELARARDGALWFVEQQGFEEELPDRVWRFDPATSEFTFRDAPDIRANGTALVGDQLWFGADRALAEVTTDVGAAPWADSIDPTVTISSPADGTTVVRGAELVADFTCEDDVEVASCIGGVEDGALLDTATPGEHELTVTATDTSGRTTTSTHTYTVVPALCDGREVTVDLRDGDAPTGGDDVILGTDGDDAVNGGAGEDVICGGGGDDQLRGGPGKDRIFGQRGADVLYAYAGGGLAVGGPGHDTVQGGSSADELRGGPGNDTLTGKAGSDRIDGGTGTNTCFGGPGRDVVLRCATDALG